MNFWKTLRRVGYLVLAVLAVTTILAAIVRNPDAGGRSWNALTGSSAEKPAKKTDDTNL
jgi:hypothetical protein